MGVDKTPEHDTPGGNGSPVIFEEEDN